VDRAAFFERAREHTGLVSVESNGALFLVRTADQGVGRSLFCKRARGEMRLMRMVSEILDAGDPEPRRGVLLDIGANIGTASIPALAAGTFERVVAFEPEPANVRLLRLNVEANALRARYRVIHAAVSDTDGETSLLVSGERSGRHEVKIEGSGKRQHPDNWAGAITVPAVTLDRCADDGVIDPDEIKLIWMDTQGHEGHVLRGAEQLTRRGIPVALELAPSLLSNHGGLDWLFEIVNRDYTHFIRIREAKGPAAQVERLPVDSFQDFVGHSMANKCTDVMFARHSP